MEIKELRLRNFRNHVNRRQVFTPALNVIVGANGTGKSNLIEAVTLLSTTKSFRNADNPQLITFGQQTAIAEAQITDHRLKVAIFSQGKTYHCDNNHIKLSSDYIGVFQTVTFSPHDLLFAENPPKLRRRFIDSELSKIDPLYLRRLREYNNLLKNRNAFLKQDNVDEELWAVLDEKLAKLMVELTNRRREYVEAINQHFTVKLRQLLSTEEVRIDYLAECQRAGYDEVLKQLRGWHIRDQLSKQTNFGTHRDDYRICYDKQPIEGYCSQGQTRLIMLALKLVLAELVEQTVNRKPVLLLDDVLSELDLEHQNKLLKLIVPRNQTLLTATHLDQGLNAFAKNIIRL